TFIIHIYITVNNINHIPRDCDYSFNKTVSAFLFPAKYREYISYRTEEFLQTGTYFPIHIEYDNISVLGRFLNIRQSVYNQSLFSNRGILHGYLLNRCHGKELAVNQCRKEQGKTYDNYP